MITIDDLKKMTNRDLISLYTDQQQAIKSYYEMIASTGKQRKIKFFMHQIEKIQASMKNLTEVAATRRINIMY